MRKQIGLIKILLAVLLLPIQLQAVSFFAEKELLTTQFNCSDEKNIPATDLNSSVWICSNQLGNYQLQLSRQQSSNELVDTLQLILITDNNQVIDESVVTLSRAIATKYAKQNSSDIVNIIKNCQQKQIFKADFHVYVGCIQGPVKTERHLIVRMNYKK
jgi:hypothetical protein